MNDKKDDEFSVKVIIEDDWGSVSSYEFVEEELDLYAYGIKAIEL